MLCRSEEQQDSGRDLASGLEFIWKRKNDKSIIFSQLLKHKESVWCRHWNSLVNWYNKRHDSETWESSGKDNSDIPSEGKQGHSLKNIDSRLGGGN